MHNALTDTHNIYEQESLANAEVCVRQLSHCHWRWRHLANRFD